MVRPHVRMKLERYSVAAAPLDDTEFDAAIHETVETAAIWFECPRAWPTFEGFLGKHIAEAQMRYQIGSDENGLLRRPERTDQFVRACYWMARSYGYFDRQPHEWEGE